MATKASVPPEKVSDTGDVPVRGHAAWKRAKVQSGLAQSEDRASLIPADKVWRELDASLGTVCRVKGEDHLRS